MRITIEIDEKKVEEIIKETGLKKKSPALAQALDEFLENRRRREFISRVLEGKTDYATSNDEVESISKIER